MSPHPTPPDGQAFLARVEAEFPALAPAVAAAAAGYPDLYRELGDRLLAFSHGLLGAKTLPLLVEGFGEFNVEVARSHVAYERRGRYENSSFSEVRKVTYDDAGFMATYNWGVMASNFAWPHHLEIYRFFRDQFLPRLAEARGRLLDLGAGTGMWSLLALEAAPDLRGSLVDLSPAAVALSRRLFEGAGLADRVDHHHHDALAFELDEPAEAGLSFFLLEHLERPVELLEGLARNLRPGAPAFVAGALTAAEVDHIFEFRRESELVALAEEAGFRVVASLSAAPQRASTRARFLPRSMGMLLERRRGEFW